MNKEITNGISIVLGTAFVATAICLAYSQMTLIYVINLI